MTYRYAIFKAKSRKQPTIEKCLVGNTKLKRFSNMDVIFKVASGLQWFQHLHNLLASFLKTWRLSTHPAQADSCSAYKVAFLIKIPPEI